MSFRADMVSIRVCGFVEFEGTVQIAFAFKPEDGDPLVAMILERNEQRLHAAALAEAQTHLPDIL